MELKTIGLTKKFGSKTAVDNLNITLTNGVYGLLGANGAGKTTLMRLLCNIQNPTSGKILLNGKNIVGLGERYRNLLGYLPQHFGYYPDFSAFDFLLYVSALKGLDEKAARKKSKELLEAVDLSRESKHKIKTFSGGMKQRLGIAQAMLNDPHILILDEPTAGLDPKERVRFRNLISAFSKDRIVILSTHIVSDVEFIAEEIIMMKSGQIIHFGNPQEITSEIDDQVWECTVPTAYAEKYAAAYNTSNLRNTSENQTILRIIGDRPPMRKVFSKRLALIALIGIILFSALLSFSTFQNKYAFDQNIGKGTGKTAVEIDKEIAAKYEGILTDKKVQQMMSDFAPTSDLHGLSAIYVYQNAMQSAAFSRFSDKEGNWNGLSVSDVFGNEEIKIGYVDGWLSTSRNMVRVFVALALAVIIMLAPIFSGEYEGVDNIILTSKYGKTKCATAKVVAGIITAILTTTLIAAFNLLLAFVFYGTEGLDCSILFAPSDYVEAFIPFNITCGTLLKYQILLAFTCTLSVTGITLFLSAISKNQIVALVAAMAIFLFPVLLPITEVNPLFRLVGLLPIYHVLAISLLSVEQMSNGMLYAIWAIPAALLFLGVGAGISRRVFAKHQVL